MIRLITKNPKELYIKDKFIINLITEILVVFILKNQENLYEYKTII